MSFNKPYKPKPGDTGTWVNYSVLWADHGVLRGSLDHAVVTGRVRWFPGSTHPLFGIERAWIATEIYYSLDDVLGLDVQARLGRPGDGMLMSVVRGAKR